MNLNEITWEEDCIRWSGHVLTGKFSHWCPDWDLLPIDETCMEFSCCTCFEEREEDESKRCTRLPSE